MMTSNGVTHNGTTVIDNYGFNLDRLKVSASIMHDYFFIINFGILIRYIII